MGDIFTKEKRSEFMAGVKSKGTKIELMVRKWLYHHGFRYRLNDKRFPGTPDIVITRFRTVIFIHGCFWHAHTNCKYFKLPKTNMDFWLEKLQSNIERDKQQVNKLRQMGWKVIIIWECELRQHPEARLNLLLDEINS